MSLVGFARSESFRIIFQVMQCKFQLFCYFLSCSLPLTYHLSLLSSWLQASFSQKAHVADAFGDGMCAVKCILFLAVCTTTSPLLLVWLLGCIEHDSFLHLLLHLQEFLFTQLSKYSLTHCFCSEVSSIYP